MYKACDGGILFVHITVIEPHLRFVEIGIKKKKKKKKTKKIMTKVIWRFDVSWIALLTNQNQPFSLFSVQLDLLWSLICSNLPNIWEYLQQACLYDIPHFSIKAEGDFHCSFDVFLEVMLEKFQRPVFTVECCTIESIENKVW